MSVGKQSPTPSVPESHPKASGLRHFIQAGGGVRVEVVSDQDDLRGLLVYLVGEVLEKLGAVTRGALVGRLYDDFAGERVQCRHPGRTECSQQEEAVLANRLPTFRAVEPSAR